MSNPISEAAVSARESHRDLSGRFGAQPASEADVDLSGPPPAGQVMTTTAYSTTVPADEAAIVTLMQIVDADGDRTAILSEEPVVNGSGRVCGTEYTVSGETAQDITDALRVDRDGDTGPREDAMSTQQITEAELTDYLTGHNLPAGNSDEYDEGWKLAQSGDPVVATDTGADLLARAVEYHNHMVGSDGFQPGLGVAAVCYTVWLRDRDYAAEMADGG